MTSDEQQQIGDWSAQQVDGSHDLVAAPATQARPVMLVPDDVYRPGPGPRPGTRTGSGNGFWIGLAVGLVPLFIGLAVLAGYVVGVGGNAATDDGTGGGTATAGASAADEVVEAGPAAGATSTVVGDGSGSSGGTADALSDESAALALTPSAEIAGGTLRLEGTLPPSSTASVADLGQLADVLGLDFVDESSVAVDAAPLPALPVSFPSAVLFVDGSDEAFEESPHAMFEAVAGYLNRGTAQLTIIAYADPTDVDSGHRSEHRGAHVKEHLLELGVDPARIVVVSRDQAEAPISDAPVNRRADLLFQIPS